MTKRDQPPKDFVDWRKREFAADLVDAALTSRGVWAVRDGKREFIGTFEVLTQNSQSFMPPDIVLHKADWRVRQFARELRGEHSVIVGTGDRVIEIAEARLVRIDLQDLEATNRRARTGDVTIRGVEWKWEPVE